MTDDRTPVLIGAGQFTQRDVDPAQAKDPLAMMVETAGRAAADAGLDARLLTEVDYIAVSSIFCWQYQNAPRLLAEQLGAHPATELYTTIGGNTPQWLVNDAAARIAAGDVRLALLTGAEAVHTVSHARRRGVELTWTTAGSGRPTVVGDARPGVSDHEMTHGLLLPTQVYPLFENALRAGNGTGLDAHQQQLGALCSRMSAVAADNPYAWFRRKRSAGEIATVTPENRMIAFPYTKYMNAIIDVDQSATVLITSVAVARSLGIHPSRWVYLWGCADAHDLWFVSERVNFYSSPAIRVAGRRALAMAGLDLGAIDYFDLYSCFPSAVQIARDMLDIPEDDPRPLTVTGGLPYHGGPGNNYTMHAIATMMDKLRAAPGTNGLVTGLGWYVTKHSVGVYSAAAPTGPWRREELQHYQGDLDQMSHPPLAHKPSGRATIETYTVLYDRDGQPNRGLVVGRLDDGRRFLANTPDDHAGLESLVAREGVGRTGVVSSSNGLNRFEPD